jgi:hypothetical protein
MTHKRSNQLCIVPVSDLASTVQFALSGARYHLRKTLSIFDSPALQRRYDDDLHLSESQRVERATEVNRFLWHLRAYFWELTAVFDHLLQWACQTHELRAKDLPIAEHEVTWSKLKDAEAHRHVEQWEREQDQLGKAYCSGWFFEVRQYRNLAHRDTIFMEWEYDELRNLNPDAAFLPAAREGQAYVPLRQHLTSYLARMRSVVTDILG